MSLHSRLTRLEQRHSSSPASGIDPAAICVAGQALEACRRQGIGVAEAVAQGVIDPAGLGGFSVGELTTAERELAEWRPFLGVQVCATAPPAPQ